MCCITWMGCCQLGRRILNGFLSVCHFPIMRTGLWIPETLMATESISLSICFLDRGSVIKVPPSRIIRYYQCDGPLIWSSTHHLHFSPIYPITQSCRTRNQLGIHHTAGYVQPRRTYCTASFEMRNKGARYRVSSVFAPSNVYFLWVGMCIEVAGFEKKNC